jgi:hypothetical protein
MAENKNWLAQTGRNYSDIDFKELGIPDELIGKDGFNRAMLDRMHAENMADYIEDGMSEAQARFEADKRRSMALKAAKANGLKL